MSKYPPIESASYQKSVNAALDVTFNVDECFPKEIAKWISYNSTILGILKSYISTPLLIGTAYCAQHATVAYEDLHTEPVILYGLVVGQSGTNKSASLCVFESRSRHHKPGLLTTNWVTFHIPLTLALLKG